MTHSDQTPPKHKREDVAMTVLAIIMLTGCGLALFAQTMITFFGWK